MNVSEERDTLCVSLWKNRTWRLFLIWVSDHVFEEKILEYLYPDDAVITFE